MHLKGADGMPNSVDSDQTAPWSSLILVCSVCLPITFYRIFMVILFCSMTPANSTQEWLIEGRRLVPLMPRLVPQTAFTVTANQAANAQAEINAALPSPSQTGIRDSKILLYF